MIAEIGGLLAGLTYLSYWDIRKRLIPVPVLLGMAIYLAALHLVFHRLTWPDMAAGAAVGLFLLLLTLLSRGKIGAGDGLLFALVIGPALGFTGTCTVLYISLLYVTGGGCIAAVRSRLGGRRETAEVPFVPFVLAAVVTTLFVRGGVL